MLFALAVVGALALIASPSWAGPPPDVYYNTFEFPDMRSINGVGMTVLQTGESPAPANGGICLGSLGSGVCTGFTFNPFPGMTIVNDPTNCHGGSWCARADLIQGDQVGAEFMLESGYTPGFVPQGCTLNGNVYPNSCVTYHMFFHWWIRWAPNFTLSPLNANGCQGKLIYVSSTAGSQFGITQNPVLGGIGIVVFRSSVPQSTLFQWESSHSGNIGSLGWTFGDGLWHEFEVETDQTNQVVNVWMDGSQFVNFSNAGLVSQAGVDTNRWGMYINHNNDPVTGAPLDHCVAQQATSFWIDDLAVSTQRIGGAATPPGTPANLTISALSGALALTALWARRR
jgi:hypothetical protein